MEVNEEAFQGHTAGGGSHERSGGSSIKLLQEEEGGLLGQLLSVHLVKMEFSSLFCEWSSCAAAGGFHQL